MINSLFYLGVYAYYFSSGPPEVGNNLYLESDHGSVAQ